MFYSKANQRLFIDRKRELNALKEKRNFAIIGLRKIGKTFLIKEFIKRNKNILCIYIDLEGIDLIPGLFAKEVIGLSVKALLKKYDEENTKFYNITNIVKFLERGGLLKISDLAEKYWASIEQEKNENNKIRFAFDFISELKKNTGKETRVFFDEFQYITELSADSIKIVRNYLQHSDLLFVFSGSATNLMEKIFFDSKSPLFEHAEKIILYPFDFIHTRMLIKKIMLLKENEYRMIHNLTFGHPFYIYRVASRIKDFEEINNRAHYSFLFEVLNPNGLLYSYFNSLYERVLTKRSSILNTMAKIIAEYNGITVLELSNAIGKDYREISVYAQRLLLTDMLVKKENKLFFRDSVFRLWMEYFKKGIVPEMEYHKVFDEVFSQLQEKYLSVSTDLGKAKEYEFKVKLEKDFRIKLENYKKGKIEFDLVGEKNGTAHIFEIKWKNEATGINDISKFFEKAQKSEFGTKTKKLFFISKTGFTEEARKLAKEKGIKLLGNI